MILAHNDHIFLEKCERELLKIQFSVWVSSCSDITVLQYDSKINMECSKQTQMFGSSSSRRDGNHLFILILRHISKSQGEIVFLLVSHTQI